MKSLLCFAPTSIVQYDVINIGKDGIGAVSSSGQGSLWRVEALKGRSPDGKTGVDPKDLSLVGHELGFRAEMLIEDTHTSIDLFRQVTFRCTLSVSAVHLMRLDLSIAKLNRVDMDQFVCVRIRSFLYSRGRK